MNSENSKKVIDDFGEWRRNEAPRDPKWRKIASNKALWALIFLFGVFLYQTIRDALSSSEALNERLNRSEDTLVENSDHGSLEASPLETQIKNTNTLESETSQESVRDKQSQNIPTRTELSTIEFREQRIKKIDDWIEKEERNKKIIFSLLVISSITTFIFLIFGTFIILNQDKIKIGVISGIIALFSGAGTTGFWKLSDNVSASIEKYREEREKNLIALERLNER
jgi:hypothetical protein